MTRTNLVLAPHTDDGELGCGATISKLIREGEKVVYAALSVCENSLPAKLDAYMLREECKVATASLGIEDLFIDYYPVRNFSSKRQVILDRLIELRDRIKPDLVFMPSSFDTHQDHEVIYQEGRRAFKHCSILGYEVPHNNFAFAPTCYQVVNRGDVHNKMMALSEYKSQRDKPYFDDTVIIAQVKLRGSQVRKIYAEAFEVIRWVT